MRRILLLAALAAAFIGAPALAQSEVVGSWDTVAETPQGSFQAVFTFSEDGDGYMVEIEDVVPENAPAGAAPMESEISDLTVDGDAFSFKRTLQSPQGPLELTYSGTVEGDALTATASSAFGEIPVTGTRK